MEFLHYHEQLFDSVNVFWKGAGSFMNYHATRKLISSSTVQIGN